MDKPIWEKPPSIKPGQRLTAEERMEYLKNNLIYLERSKERDIERNKTLDAMTVTIAEIAERSNRLHNDSETLSQYWQQVAIERQEFRDKIQKIVNELKNRDSGNSQSQ